MFEGVNSWIAGALALGSALFGALIPAVIKRLLPTRQENAETAKTQVEVDGLRWKQFVDREAWLTQKIKDVEKRLSVLEKDRRHAMDLAEFYRDTLIASGIEPPPFKPRGNPLFVVPGDE